MIYITICFISVFSLEYTSFWKTGAMPTLFTSEFLVPPITWHRGHTQHLLDKYINPYEHPDSHVTGERESHWQGR